MARSRARARLNCSSHGQRRGRCRVNRRAERVIRPAKAKTRRLRVLVVTIPFTQADAGCPSGQVMGDHLYCQPGAVGGEAAGRHVVQSDTVLEVAYRILDLGVTAMISLQFQHLPIAVGDEAVIAVGGEEGQLGTGRGLHPPDDEPHRRGVGLTLEGDIGGLGHIGGAVHPVGNRRPGIFRYGLDDIVQVAFVLAEGDGEADRFSVSLSQIPSCGRRIPRFMSVEAAVGPHRELSPGPGVAHPPHRLTQEVGGAAGGVGAALAQAGHQHVSDAGGDSQQPVIAPRVGVAVVAGAHFLLVQSVGLADGGVQVDGQGCVAGSGPSRPGSSRVCQQLAAHAVELTDVAPAKTAQEGAQGGGSLSRETENADGPAGRAAHRRRRCSRH